MSVELLTQIITIVVALAPLAVLCTDLRLVVVLRWACPCCGRHWLNA
jgi:hypothetical protein